MLELGEGLLGSEDLLWGSPPTVASCLTTQGRTHCQASQKIAPVEIFNFFSGPRSSPQEFKARLDAWGMSEASDFDFLPQGRPTEMLHQTGHYHFQSYAM